MQALQDKKTGIYLDNCSYDRLNENEWFNDEVINSYISLLNQH